ncbi:glycoside hydrolase family 2 TIM barrel-domain containing protein [Mucilaginibacter metallidurans]|uniref:glycoside hydrolase family 2 TIM barrel-domain containing protein n=1 Tax=Mucilaginibacter sp. P4 TaxID=3383180 RepID=UPI00142F0D08|nr:glycoside hydrolase family 2 TIM barrel-domain containing protein [Mucilaginibacter gossypii]
MDSAQAHHLAVIAGLPMPPSESIDDFYKTPKASAHVSKIAGIVNRFKHHPALLSWCVGNELAFPYKPKYNQFYTIFNDVVDMIHQDDPQHPVTTTIMSFQKKNIVNIKLRTKIDFISFNIFGSIQTLNEDLQKFNWFWDGPFLITEWGIEGPWTADSQNAWGLILKIPVQKRQSNIFQPMKSICRLIIPGFWVDGILLGQKQELTPTWFSMFDENGAETEAVQVMHYIWTGQKAPKKAPVLKYMLVDGKGARDNILFKPGITINSKVYIEDPDTTGLTFKWEIFAEDWFKPNGAFNQKKPKEIKNLIIGQSGPDLKFKVPATEGPYRLLVYVYDQKGSFATSNTPFYVLKNP